MDVANSAVGPALVGANWYRFRAAENIHHPHVHSVSFVWVVQGSGEVASAGETYRLTTGSVLRLPWRHDVQYRPDAPSPFHVGTIHVVPRHDLAIPIEPRVGYLAGDPLLDAPWRQGPAASERAVLRPSRSTSARNVIALASYGVERFLSGRVEDSALRSLGGLIADESDGWALAEPGALGSPTVLDLMTDSILADLGRPITVAEVAAAGGCSTTTAERMFVRHTGLSIGAWSRARRMDEAAFLLRTSGLRVNEVARRVGYQDPLYFSRVFAAVFHVPPSRYAQDQMRP